jgi:hypothetical protein
MVMSVNSKMTAIADAIRAKTGGTNLLSLDDMATQIANISTGAELNFDVVAYEDLDTLLASTPGPNTIGIVTTTPITGWIFSVEMPTNPSKDIVWVSTGDEIDGSFNALIGVNSIMVYPKFAKQYIDGQWVDVTAKIFQNGNWIDLAPDFVIFETGYGARVQYLTKKGSSASISTNSDGITFSYSGDTALSDLAWYTAEKIDMSKFKTLKITVNLTSVSSSHNYIGFGLMTKVPTVDNFSAQSWVASKGIKTKGIVEYVIDIESYDDSYYVVFCGAVCEGKVIDFRACM